MSQDSNTPIHHHPETPPGPTQEQKPVAVSPFRNKGTFSTEKAREMLAKARAAKAAKAEARRQAALNPPPPPQPEPETLPQGQSEELEIVQEQITRTRKQLRDDMEPNERAQLVRALDLMLDRKRILQERPLPGSRRPAPERVQARGSSLIQSLPAPPKK